MLRWRRASSGAPRDRFGLTGWLPELFLCIHFHYYFLRRTTSSFLPLFFTIPNTHHPPSLFNYSFLLFNIHPNQNLLFFFHIFSFYFTKHCIFTFLFLFNLLIYFSIKSQFHLKKN